MSILSKAVMKSETSEGSRPKKILKIHDLENKIVFKQSLENEDVYMNCYLDLSNKTEEQILIAAAEHFHIRHLRKQHFNKMTNTRLVEEHGKTFDLVQYEPTRVKVDDVERARRSIAALSPAQLEQLIQDEKTTEDMKAYLQKVAERPASED